LLLLSPQSANDLTKANPQQKIGLSSGWKIGRWDLIWRETRWGASDFVQGYGAPTRYPTVRVPAANLTDLSITYLFPTGMILTLGGNNVFDHMPPYTPQVLRSVRNGPAYVISTPYGDQGAYFFSRAALAF
jgi:outer membrane receptor protein involved in Fe transport